MVQSGLSQLGEWLTAEPTDLLTSALPERVLLGDEGERIPFHLAQNLAYDATTRIVALIAGTQGGKTKFAPMWMVREIYGGTQNGQVYAGGGRGDYLVVTSSYELYKMKLLPAFRLVFEEVLGVARFWSSAGVLELIDPETKTFLATHSQDKMWGRIILRSAQALGGLESGTVKGMVLDEAGQDTFTLGAYKALQRRGAIYRARTLITTTLYNLDWVKTKVIDRAEQEGSRKETYTVASGGEIEVTTNLAADVTLIQYDSIVNPAYSAAEFEAARADNADDEFEMFWRGRVTSLRLNIYNTFDERLDVRAPFELHPLWRRWLGLDFGGVNLVGLFYAEEPGTGRLYGYREYHAGNRSIAEHVAALLEGEREVPMCYGGSGSEDQWRLNFAVAGLPVMEPRVQSVSVGINKVYAKHKAHQILYFKTLKQTIAQIKRYRHKRDKSGEVTAEIENKSQFHFMDAERYIISSFAVYAGGDAEVTEY